MLRCSGSAIQKYALPIVLCHTLETVSTEMLSSLGMETIMHSNTKATYMMVEPINSV
jgi:hypothetical protein